VCVKSKSSIDVSMIALTAFSALSAQNRLTGLALRLDSAILVLKICTLVVGLILLILTLDLGLGCCNNGTICADWPRRGFGI